MIIVGTAGCFSPSEDADTDQGTTSETSDTQQQPQNPSTSGPLTGSTTSDPATTLPGDGTSSGSSSATEVGSSSDETGDTDTGLDTDTDTDTDTDADASSSSDSSSSSGGLVDTTKRVFVSSATLSTTQLGSADIVCNSIAGGAGLDGDWVAWVSDSETNAIDKLDPEAGPYVLLNAAQTVIALDNDDLTDGTLAAPINIDEFGQPHGVFTATWTGTQTDGTVHANNCLDWTVDTNAQTGLRGNVTITGTGWTGIASVACSSSGKVYCFER